MSQGRDRPHGWVNGVAGGRELSPTAKHHLWLVWWPWGIAGKAGPGLAIMCGFATRHLTHWLGQSCKGRKTRQMSMYKQADLGLIRCPTPMLFDFHRVDSTTPVVLC